MSEALFDFDDSTSLAWYCFDERYHGPWIPPNHFLWQFAPGHPVMMERWQDD